jgi:type II secretory pathway pseudopilin PulG
LKVFRGVSELQKRPGVTIMEVLAASAILVVAMAAISSTVSMALRKAKTPGQTEAAALLASERLHYYRSQADPYRAAGGTHYTDPDVNRVAGNHNTFDGNPRLFVREYLYGTTANEVKSAIGPADVGLANQRRRALVGDPGNAWSLNQIPVTAPGVSRVLPNPDGTVITPVPAALAGIPGATEVLAPRANARISPTGTPADRNIPGDIKFVREVWIQTNFPNSLPVPDLAALAGLWDFPARPARNLPDYTVALTVRVFARDPLTRTLGLESALPPGLDVPRNGVTGPGYDRRKPLAVIVGYFGLRRML